MKNTQCNANLLGSGLRECWQGKTRLIYHPSNSNKGIAIKGTNLRVEIQRY